MRAFKDITPKSIMGMVHCFKLHLLYNEKGEIINFVLT